TVEEKHKTELRYRFSEALVCSWNPSEQSTKKINSMLAKQNSISAGNFCRTYVVARNTELRKHLTSILSKNSFEVKFALQLQAITTEPKFFGPDLVIIEDSLTT